MDSNKWTQLQKISSSATHKQHLQIGKAKFNQLLMPKLSFGDQSVHGSNLFK
jgi:hypothetical protein